MAAEGNHRETVQILLQAEAVVDRLDAEGRTPLHRHLRSSQRRREIVSLLLNGGADANAKDRNGRTILDEATRDNPRHPLAERLRKRGAVES